MQKTENGCDAYVRGAGNSLVAFNTLSEVLTVKCKIEGTEAEFEKLEEIAPMWVMRLLDTFLTDCIFEWTLTSGRDKDVVIFWLVMAGFTVRKIRD